MEATIGAEGRDRSEGHDTRPPPSSSAAFLIHVMLHRIPPYQHYGAARQSAKRRPGNFSARPSARLLDVPVVQRKWG